jgi:hypothetical protein
MNTILPQEINLIEAAWHDHNPEKPRGEIEGAPERRVPIRGLFFYYKNLPESSKFTLFQVFSSLSQPLPGIANCVTSGWVICIAPHFTSSLTGTYAM